MGAPIVPVQPPTDSPPGSGIPILGPILSTLASIFSNKEQVQDLANSTERVEETAWTNLLSLSAFSYGLFGGILTALHGLVHAIGAALGHIIHDILHGHLLHLIQDLLGLIQKLRNFLAPLIKWLQRLQAIQRKYQMDTLRKAINLIQRVRKILLPLRLLHVKFATKLDNWLAGIEGKLIHGTLSIARKTNEILGWVNVFGDESGFLRGKWLWGSIGRDMAAIAAAARALDLKAEFPRVLDQHWTPHPATPAVPLKQLP